MKVWIVMSCFVIATGTAFALDLQSVLNDGWTHFNNSNYKRAASAFETAARIDPSSAEAFKGIGMSYMKKGQAEYNPGLVANAADAFQKALDLNPNMPDIRFQLGVACLAIDNKPDAEKQYQALISANKSLADQLAEKIAAYKPPSKPVQYREVGETIIETSGPTHSWGNCDPGETWNSATNTCSTPPRMTRTESETTVSSDESFGFGSKKKSRNNDNYRVNTEQKTVNTGAVNPVTGEYYAPAGRGYVGTRDGTYYAPAGTNGMIDTRTGQFIPVH